MSYLGNDPAEAYSPTVKDTFSGNGSTTDFTLSIPATTNGVEVFVENVQQEPTDAYTISGTTLSFTAAPVSGTDNIYVIHRGPAVQQVVPPAGVAINASTVTGTGDMNIDSGTLFVDASTNRVGIGTSSPNRKLDVRSTQQITATFQHTDGDTATISFVNTSSTDDDDDQIGTTSGNNFFVRTAGQERMRIDSNGNLKFASGFGSVATAYGCRAWVNFNGTGTPSIREDGNVSSIGDNATGDFTINFATAMPDANYCWVFAGQLDGTGNDDNGSFNTKRSDGTGGKLTTSIRVICQSNSNLSKEDPLYFTGAIFR